GWKKTLPALQFDHSKTKYPLLGEHIKVSCIACHASGNFEKPLKFANCTDCHKDIHNGQFANRPQKGECSECHKVEGWKPSLFGVKEHATSKYPLEGKHAKVECAKCHIPAGKETIYKVKFASCTDCHKDAHDGQFAGKPYLNRCEPCHTVADFHRTLFTIAKHKQTKFPLTGAHVAVSCAECHKVGAAGRKDKIIPFYFKDKTCTGCHADPHRGSTWRDSTTRKLNSPCLASIDRSLATIATKLFRERRKSSSKRLRWFAKHATWMFMQNNSPSSKERRTVPPATMPSAGSPRTSTIAGQSSPWRAATRELRVTNATASSKLWMASRCFSINLHRSCAKPVMARK